MARLKRWSKSPRFAVWKVVPGFLWYNFTLVMLIITEAYVDASGAIPPFLGEE
jgi:hypothetical protein